jgi:3-phenylpropionate/trans-cinnamate dioxygenase ferredoxin reductase subunit
VAAANHLGGDEIHEAIPWFWSDQYELGLQVAGLPALAVTEVARTPDDGGSLRFGLDRDDRLVSVGGIAPGTGIAKHVRLGERMIAGGLRPDPAELADSSVSLKALLRQEG